MSGKRGVDLATVANESACLLNEGIRQLLIPQHLFEMFTQLEAQGRTSERYAAAVRHTAIIAAVVGLYRIHEAREEMLVPWLYTDAELREYGFVPIREFVSDWKSFEIIRSQNFAHATSHRAKAGRRPGRLIPGTVLGRALRRTGLWDTTSFLRRVREDLVPSVSKVRDALLVRFPAARQFVEGGYLAEIENGASSS
jgi:hypothetical protein